MNKLLPLLLFVFFIHFTLAQEVNKSSIDYNPVEVLLIKNEKQQLKASSSFTDEKFKHIHAGSVSSNTSSQSIDKDAIQAKIEYLQNLNCCEAKIEELEAQLADINN